MEKNHHDQRLGRIHDVYRNTDKFKTFNLNLEDHLDWSIKV